MDIQALRNKEEQIKELLKAQFETEIRSDIGVSSYIIFRDGTLVGAYKHRDMMNFLRDKGVISDEEVERFDTTVFTDALGCVSCYGFNKEGSSIELPKESLTSDQESTLADWIDADAEKSKQLTVDLVYSPRNAITYNYDELFKAKEWPSEYIIQKIKDGYLQDKLMEDVNVGLASYDAPKRYKHATILTPEEFLKVEDYFINDLSIRPDLTPFQRRVCNYFEDDILKYRDKIVSGEVVTFIGKLNGIYYIMAAVPNPDTGVLRSLPFSYVWLNDGKLDWSIYEGILKLLRNHKEDVNEDIDIQPYSRESNKHLMSLSIGPYTDIDCYLLSADCAREIFSQLDNIEFSNEWEKRQVESLSVEALAVRTWMYFGDRCNHSVYESTMKGTLNTSGIHLKVNDDVNKWIKDLIVNYPYEEIHVKQAEDEPEPETAVDAHEREYNRVVYHEELRKDNLQELIAQLQAKKVDIKSFWNICDASQHLEGLTDEELEDYNKAREELHNIQSKVSVTGFYKGEPDPGSYLVWDIPAEKAIELGLRLRQEDIIHTQISEKYNTILSVRYKNAQNHDFKKFDEDHETSSLVLVDKKPDNLFKDRGCTGWSNDGFFYSFDLYKEYSSAQDKEKFHKLELDEDIKLSTVKIPEVTVNPKYIYADQEYGYQRDYVLSFVADHRNEPHWAVRVFNNTPRSYDEVYIIKDVTFNEAYAVFESTEPESCMPSAQTIVVCIDYLGTDDHCGLFSRDIKREAVHEDIAVSEPEDSGIIPDEAKDEVLKYLAEFLREDDVEDMRDNYKHEAWSFAMDSEDYNTNYPYGLYAGDKCLCALTETEAFTIGDIVKEYKTTNEDLNINTLEVPFDEKYYCENSDYNLEEVIDLVNTHADEKVWTVRAYLVDDNNQIDRAILVAPLATFEDAYKSFCDYKMQDGEAAVSLDYNGMWLDTVLWRDIWNNPESPFKATQLETFDVVDEDINVSTVDIPEYDEKYAYGLGDRPMTVCNTGMDDVLSKDNDGLIRFGGEVVNGREPRTATIKYFYDEPVWFICISGGHNERFNGLCGDPGALHLSNEYKGAHTFADTYNLFMKYHLNEGEVIYVTLSDDFDNLNGSGWFILERKTNDTPESNSIEEDIRPVAPDNSWTISVEQHDKCQDIHKFIAKHFGEHLADDYMDFSAPWTVVKNGEDDYTLYAGGSDKETHSQNIGFSITKVPGNGDGFMDDFKDALRNTIGDSFHEDVNVSTPIEYLSKYIEPATVDDVEKALSEDKGSAFVISPDGKLEHIKDEYVRKFVDVDGNYIDDASFEYANEDLRQNYVTIVYYVDKTISARDIHLPDWGHNLTDAQLNTLRELNKIPSATSFYIYPNGFTTTLPRYIEIKDDIDANARPGRIMESRDEYFKNSMVRNSDGTLKPVYHCSFNDFDTFIIGNEDGTLDFDDWKGESGFAWFSESEWYAQQYGDADFEYECYLNITNPLDLGDINQDIFDENGTEVKIKQRPKGRRYKFTDWWESSDSVKVSDAFINLCKLVDIAPEDMLVYAIKWGETEMIFDLTRRAFFKNLVVKKGYDGVTAIESGYRTWGCVRPNQIKLINNDNPTDSDSMKEDITPSTVEKFEYDVPLNKLEEIAEYIDGQDDGVLISAKDLILSDLHHKVTLSFNAGEDSTDCALLIYYSEYKSPTRLALTWYLPEYEANYILKNILKEPVREDITPVTLDNVNILAKGDPNGDPSTRVTIDVSTDEEVKQSVVAGFHETNVVNKLYQMAENPEYIWEYHTIIAQINNNYGYITIRHGDNYILGRYDSGFRVYDKEIRDHIIRSVPELSHYLKEDVNVQTTRSTFEIPEEHKQFVKQCISNLPFIAMNIDDIMEKCIDNKWEIITCNNDVQGDPDSYPHRVVFGPGEDDCLDISEYELSKILHAAKHGNLNLFGEDLTLTPIEPRKYELKPDDVVLNKEQYELIKSYFDRAHRGTQKDWQYWFDRYVAIYNNLISKGRNFVVLNTKDARVEVHSTDTNRRVSNAYTFIPKALVKQVLEIKNEPVEEDIQPSAPSSFVHKDDERGDGQSRYEAMYTISPDMLYVLRNLVDEVYDDNAFNKRIVARNLDKSIKEFEDGSDFHGADANGNFRLHITVFPTDIEYRLWFTHCIEHLVSVTREELCSDTPAEDYEFAKAIEQVCNIEPSVIDKYKDSLLNNTPLRITEDITVASSDFDYEPKYLNLEPGHPQREESMQFINDHWNEKIWYLVGHYYKQNQRNHFDYGVEVDGSKQSPENFTNDKYNGYMTFPEAYNKFISFDIKDLVPDYNPDKGWWITMCADGFSESTGVDMPKSRPLDILFRDEFADNLEEDIQPSKIPPAVYDKKYLMTGQYYGQSMAELIDKYQFEESWYLDELNYDVESLHSGKYDEFVDNRFNGLKTFEDAYKAFLEYKFPTEQEDKNYRDYADIRIVYCDMEDENDVHDIDTLIKTRYQETREDLQLKPVPDKAVKDDVYNCYNVISKDGKDYIIGLFNKYQDIPTYKHIVNRLTQCKDSDEYEWILDHDRFRGWLLSIYHILNPQTDAGYFVGEDEIIPVDQDEFEKYMSIHEDLTLRPTEQRAFYDDKYLVSSDFEDKAAAIEFIEENCEEPHWTVRTISMDGDTLDYADTDLTFAEAYEQFLEIEPYIEEGEDKVVLGYDDYDWDGDVGNASDCICVDLLEKGEEAVTEDISYAPSYTAGNSSSINFNKKYLAHSNLPNFELAAKTIVQYFGANPWFKVELSSHHFTRNGQTRWKTRRLAEGATFSDAYNAFTGWEFRDCDEDLTLSLDWSRISDNDRTELKSIGEEVIPLDKREWWPICGNILERRNNPISVRAISQPITEDLNVTAAEPVVKYDTRYAVNDEAYALIDAHHDEAVWNVFVWHYEPSDTRSVVLDSLWLGATFEDAYDTFKNGVDVDNYSWVNTDEVYLTLEYENVDTEDECIVLQRKITDLCEDIHAQPVDIHGMIAPYFIEGPTWKDYSLCHYPRRVDNKTYTNRELIDTFMGEPYWQIGTHSSTDLGTGGIVDEDLTFEEAFEVFLNFKTDSEYTKYVCIDFCKGNLITPVCVREIKHDNPPVNEDITPTEVESILSDEAMKYLLIGEGELAAFSSFEEAINYIDELADEPVWSVHVYNKYGEEEDDPGHCLTFKEAYKLFIDYELEPASDENPDLSKCNIVIECNPDDHQHTFKQAFDKWYDDEILDDECKVLHPLAEDLQLTKVEPKYHIEFKEDNDLFESSITIVMDNPEASELVKQTYIAGRGIRRNDFAYDVTDIYIEYDLMSEFTVNLECNHGDDENPDLIYLERASWGINTPKKFQALDAALKALLTEEDYKKVTESNTFKWAYEDVFEGGNDLDITEVGIAEDIQPVTLDIPKYERKYISNWAFSNADDCEAFIATHWQDDGWSLRVFDRHGAEMYNPIADRPSSFKEAYDEFCNYGFDYDEDDDCIVMGYYDEDEDDYIEVFMRYKDEDIDEDITPTVIDVPEFSIEKVHEIGGRFVTSYIDGDTEEDAANFIHAYGDEPKWNLGEWVGNGMHYRELLNDVSFFDAWAELVKRAKDPEYFELRFTDSEMGLHTDALIILDNRHNEPYEPFVEDITPTAIDISEFSVGNVHSMGGQFIKEHVAHAHTDEDVVQFIEDHADEPIWNLSRWVGDNLDYDGYICDEVPFIDAWNELVSQAQKQDQKDYFELRFRKQPWDTRDAVIILNCTDRNMLDEDIQPVTIDINPNEANKELMSKFLSEMCFAGNEDNLYEMDDYLFEEFQNDIECGWHFHDGLVDKVYIPWMGDAEYDDTMSDDMANAIYEGNTEFFRAHEGYIKPYGGNASNMEVEEAIAQEAELWGLSQEEIDEFIQNNKK